MSVSLRFQSAWGKTRSTPFATRACWAISLSLHAEPCPRASSVTFFRYCSEIHLTISSLMVPDARASRWETVLVSVWPTPKEKPPMLALLRHRLLSELRFAALRAPSRMGGAIAGSLINAKLSSNSKDHM